MNEEWRPVVSYEGWYEVSNRGRVRSINRVGVHPKSGPSKYAGRILKINPRESGHCYVSLARNGLVAVLGVHRLVLEAFVGPCPDGMEGCHNNGDPANNRVENLRWDTHANNMHDVIEHGTSFQAAKTCCPRGHMLIAPNLVPSKAKRGYRECLSCSYAYRVLWQRGLPFDRSLADERYLAIMPTELITERSAV